MRVEEPGDTGACSEQTCDLNYKRHVGWDEGNFCIREFFSPKTVAMISKKVTELTLGVDPKNRPIIVPNARICEVMSSIFWNFRPATGDIFTRYIVPNNEQDNMVQTMIDQTIEVITSHIRNELGIVEENQKLSAWVQVLGDFNTHNLRQFPPIKTREKRPSPMLFNMNY